MKVVQFLPYFPPHKGGLETVAEEFSKYFVSEGYGEVLNVVFGVGQEKGIKEYEKDGYKVLVIPAFDIIPNYPVPKFWTKEFGKAIKKAKKWNPDVIQTHTRFFLSSFLGGWCAKRWKKKWVHIEHGSDYIQVSSGFTNKIAYIYDRIIGKRVFKKADYIVPISNACKRFIEKEFQRKNNIQVIYRGLDIPGKLPEVEDLHKKFKDKIIVGFIGRLYKWKNVESLVKAYYDIDKELQNKIQIVVVGDGEDMNYLKSLDKNNKIYFTGGKPFLEALAYQKQFDIHYHTSNPGGGLATTLLQAMYFGCLIVATPNEGATDVLVDGENAIVLKDSSLSEIKRGLEECVRLVGKKSEWIKKNKEIIENQFQWKKNIKMFCNGFKKIGNTDDKQIEMIIQGKLPLKDKILGMCVQLKKIYLTLKYGKFKGLKNIEGLDEYNIEKDSLYGKNKKNGISGFARLKNGGDFLDKVIESHLPFMDEIILVDNNSTDNTREICQRLEKNYPQKIKIYQYKHQIPKLGSIEFKNTSENSVHSFSYFSNWVLSKTSYKYVLKIDDDHLVIPSVIKEITDNIRKNGLNVFLSVGLYNVIEINNEIYLPRDSAFAGLYGDAGFFPLNGRTYFIKDGGLENYTHNLMIKYYGIGFYHLKFLKRGEGIINYEGKVKNRIMKYKDKGFYKLSEEIQKHFYSIFKK